MQFVIDIDEEDYERLKEYKKAPFRSLTSRAYEAIANGTPLPEGHGDLVDRGAINERFYSIYNDAMNCSNQPSDKYLLNNLSMCLDTASTIIKADSEGKDATCD